MLWLSHSLLAAEAVVLDPPILADVPTPEDTPPESAFTSASDEETSGAAGCSAVEGADCSDKCDLLSALSMITSNKLSN